MASSINYFFSGTMSQRKAEAEVMAATPRGRLCSCHASYMREATYWAGLLSNEPDRKEMMLDSGAFTAWSKGDHVDIEDLIRHYASIVEPQAHKIGAVWLINLDVIPGSPGVTATPEEMDKAMEDSDANYYRLVSEFGNIVLPVYHQGEPISRLAVLENMSDYICVSPRNDLPEQYRVSWAAEVHHHTTKRTHGLATTGTAMMSSAHWHSVDSASWIMAGAMGSINYVQDGILKIISISSDSPNRKDFGRHFDTLIPEAQEMIAMRAARYGITIEDLRTNYVKRNLMNGSEIMAWLDAVEFDKPPRQTGLFDL